jgi:hypothetical protein
MAARSGRLRLSAIRGEAHERPSVEQMDGHVRALSHRGHHADQARRMTRDRHARRPPFRLPSATYGASMGRNPRTAHHPRLRRADRNDDPEWAGIWAGQCLICRHSHHPGASLPASGRKQTQGVQPRHRATQDRALEPYPILNGWGMGGAKGSSAAPPRSRGSRWSRPRP